MTTDSTLVLESVLPTFRAVVTTVVPEASELDSAQWQDVELLVDQAVSERPPSMIRQLRLFLRLIQWLPMLRYGRPFTALDPDRRARFLSRLQTNRLKVVRVGFWGLRTLALMGYYGRLQAAEAIGYAAHPRGWEAL